MTPVTENELKAHQEKIGGKRVTLDALKEEMMKEVPSGDFKDRVREEARQLQENIGKLDAFINGSVQFDRLSVAEQNDLREQHVAMTEYYGVLMRRINRFG